MAAIVQPLVLLAFFTSLVEAGRLLRLDSSYDELVSDGLESSFKTNGSTPSACNHQYGFLPCVENSAGYIFQTLVYQAIVMYGKKQIGSGSKVLFNIIGANKLGGIIFRILMALPPLVLMIVSGIFSSTETAQSQVSVGVGIYTGITVFSLTIQWGVCVIFGTPELKKSDEHIGGTCFPAKEKLLILKDSGVKIDKETRSTARIMLLSLIPYVVVQLVGVFNTSPGKRIMTLLALIVSSLSLLSYFSYQILNPWMSQRSLDYLKYETVRNAFLEHAEQDGQLQNEDGELNKDVLVKLFKKKDKDDDHRITEPEVEHWVHDINRKLRVVEEKDAVKHFMRSFDFDCSTSITVEEFIKGYEKWIDEVKRSSYQANHSAASGNIVHRLFNWFKEKKEKNSQEIAGIIMSKVLTRDLLKSESLITEDGEPNVEHIQNLFNKFVRHEDNAITREELKQLISSVNSDEFQIKGEDELKELFKKLDVDCNNLIHEVEFVEGVKKWLSKAISADKNNEKVATFNKWLASILAVFQVSSGALILTFLGDPLTSGIQQLSSAMKFSPFIISFVVVPCAMNLRPALKALLPASQKTQKSASLTFSEIYGGVIMNNVAGLTALLAIVYAKGLTWDFSAEVLTIMVVCAIIGILAYTSDTYRLWTCILAFVLYPLSLGLFYFFHVFVSWN